MVGQIFVFIVGMIGLVVGLVEGDYLWAFAGLVVVLSGVHLIYKIKTGKNIWDKENR
ncbi:hypothetical protein JF535_00730 [Microbulbifer salipaludis]|uniref:Uncharacterized protein n=1 Tax=Microbulbifer salipaludis TaxID=187980 RepID=A0ABS3E263_9GAMM|nr:hypothetical protein [Microbulbifer salipaludis]MBN8429362.1 hypothetical protein [Microbulbifer salipaludis]